LSESTFKRFGLFDGCLYALNVFADRYLGGFILARRYFLMAQPLKIPIKLPKRLGSSLRVASIDTESADLAKLPRPYPVLLGRLESGSVCLGVYLGKDLAGFIWLHVGNYVEDEVRCTYVPKPENQSAWDYDIFVDPAHRNSFVFLKLWLAAIEYLHDQGRSWTFSRISAFSPESIAAHARLGAKKIGTALFVKIGSAQICFATVPPYVDLSGRNGVGPEFTLRIPTH
jgi:hypothetical protein